MSPEIVIAIISGAAVVLAAMLPALIAAVRRGNTMRDEMSFQRAALSFDDYIEEWAELHTDLQELIEKTSIDRFLILRAWNGLREPKWTSAIFQWRDNKQACVSYVHWPLDEDYVARLNHIRTKGPMVLKVHDLPDSAIKDVYLSEKLSESVWFFISDKDSRHGAKAVVYCTFATHEGEIDTAALTACRRIVGRLIAIAQKIPSEKKIVAEQHFGNKNSQPQPSLALKKA